MISMDSEENLSRNSTINNEFLKSLSEAQFVGSLFKKRDNVYEKFSRTCRRTRWVRAPAAKSKDLNLIPGTKRWKDRKFMQDVL